MKSLVDAPFDVCYAAYPHISGWCDGGMASNTNNSMARTPRQRTVMFLQANYIAKQSMYCGMVNYSCAVCVVWSTIAVQYVWYGQL